MRVLELHAAVRVVQRSKGRSAVAAAAYRSGTRLVDERTGLTHDYTRKQGVEATALLLPDEAPDWAHDRGALWNAAERQEKHPRAQTARDLEVAFPAEFDAAQRREAGLRIGQWLTQRHGVAVDMAWHAPSRTGDQRNHHAHFLFATRRFENGGWAKTKDRTLDEVAGRTVGGVYQPPRGPAEIKALRLAVADVLNTIAARDRLPVYTEHLSYAQRGLDQEATQHLGPVATEMERVGTVTDIGARNRSIQRRNARRRDLEQEAIVIDFELAKAALRTKQQAQGREEARARQTRAEAYAAFCAETQARRAALLEAFQQEHGGREQALRQEVVRVTGRLDDTGLVARLWRNLTGRTQQDQQALEQARDGLGAIASRRQQLAEDFERERLVRLEAHRQGQRAEAQDTERRQVRAAGGGSPAPPDTPPDDGTGSSAPGDAGASAETGHEPDRSLDHEDDPDFGYGY